MKLADAGDGRLLIDTHVWLWLAQGAASKLAPAVQAELEAASQQGRLVLSIISVWEVALLHSKGRILLSMPLALWLERALASSGLTLLPLAQPTVMVDACTLPGEFHADPADRILVATARAENATLVTRDEKILAYAQAGHVRVQAI
ncbi:MAG: type II toxin-antitoxin system VapC family toxin [Burkholderiales bacterium]|jgi:PIN domain nuclease of toxin-antitoxin system|nr:type II toxin-antitoxin system VapC family toxin [Burkholderiales bacterium]MBP6250149.1 type II toxin-antitoxin system VapC family toxin [Leptothrix sp. (in: b-proteobacteria)]MBP7519359.1 type II toxin-antitoxin system VapC family toxin [Leptothrix sp. (in: b-proteobacteria)]